LAQITIEYMIMVPVLIMLIFLLPFTTSLIMDGWADSRRTLALREMAGHLGSSIQQLYSSLSHESVTAGSVTYKLEISPFIEGYAYVGNATLRSILDPSFNSSKILDTTLSLMGANGEATVSITLGQNVEWIQSSTFMSNSTDASINAEKYWAGTGYIIRMYFG